MHRAGLIVGALVVLCACHHAKGWGTDDRRAVMSIEEGRRIYDTAYTPNARGYVPSSEELNELEDHLVPYLRGEHPALAARAPSDWRQYVGYVDQSGTRWIWASFQCRLGPYLAPHFRTHLIVVSDGGDCFFQVEYSPDTERFRHLMINGRA